MSEWWTYSPSDFLLFTPRTYYRLFELYNAALWPAQIAAVAVGGAILAFAWSGRPWCGRAIAGLLSLAWLWVAWAFLLERYQTINWAAEYIAWGFAAEALLLILFGVFGNRLRFAAPMGGAQWLGLGLFLCALLGQPFVGVLFGRPLAQAEIFGFAPDPTVIATLGVIVIAGRPIAWALLILPLVWCVVGALTLWVMEAPDALLLPLAAILALIACAWPRRRVGAIAAARITRRVV